jgi:hypothetical protein
MIFACPFDETEPPTADFYRAKAEEIRQAARQVRSHLVAEELLELADRFDRMAAYVERRVLNAEG